MNVLINILIFFIVLFLYIHITSQYKKSQDLEIYEMDYINNKQLQEVCDLKQPILFNYSQINPEFIEDVTIDTLIVQGSHDINIKDINDYWKEEQSIDYVVLPFQSSHNLMVTDTSSKFFTENNDEFIQESGFSKKFHENDTFLKPDFSPITKFDVCMGSKNTVTPLRYHTNFRHFLCVNSGKITIKLTPWKSQKYLHMIKDYDNYEFRSLINVWNTQPQYKNDMDKIKFLEFDVNPGYMVYIPPFWFYSIKFSSNSDNLVCGFTYNSIMNCIANIPNYFLYFIQQNNIKKKVMRTLDVKSSENATNPDIIESSI